MKIFELTDIPAYQKATEFSDTVWNFVSKWESFEKKSLGLQFTRAADSISANIAESQGRHFKKDKINFYRYSRGSGFECIDWLNKSYRRNLISEEQYKELSLSIDDILKEINVLIRLTKENLKY
ncbi:MAG: four helix bundle protein [Bacteroidales bacterium]|jgi:four helix bundle protein|nr:four helix bundle protein [Bacteroidales bacterium]